MACKHEQIKCVNCVKSCLICGEILPADFLPGKSTPKAEKAAETPENGEKKETEKPAKGGRKQTAKKGDAE